MPPVLWTGKLSTPMTLLVNCSNIIGNTRNKTAEEIQKTRDFFVRHNVTKIILLPIKTSVILRE